MKPMRHRMLLLYSIAVLIFLYLPILVLIVFSFNQSRFNASWTGFTWDWYLSLFKNREVLKALTNSLIVATVATIASTLMGTLAAIGLHKNKIRFRSAVDGLIYLPIIIPEIVMGLSLLLLFSQLQIPLGRTTIIIAHITFCVSFVIITVSARLEGMGKQLDEAAQDLGATPFQTFRYVTLPLIMPGILAGALMAFTLSIDDFVISFFVAGPGADTLPLYIYGMVKRGITPEINALSTVMIVVTMILVILADRVGAKGTNDEKTRKRVPL